MTNPIILEKKPLVEAIFEIRWELTGVNTFAPGGPPSDANYDLMVGAMREKLKEKFPSHVRLPAAQIPGMMMPYQPQHQFRSGNLGWPLVQIGSGVLTINETDTYSSISFIPMCLEVLAVAHSFWTDVGSVPRIVYAALRYVDAIEIEKNSNVQETLRLLGVNIDFKEKIFGDKRVDSPLNALQLSTSIRTNKPVGQLDMAFNKGVKDSTEALIWETSISSSDSECEKFIENSKEWLISAHDLAHDVFFSMVEGDLLGKFK